MMRLMTNDLAKLIAESGLTQVEIARRADLPASRISDYKSGTPIPPKHVNRLARILGVSPRRISSDFDFNSPVDPEMLAALIYGATKRISDMGSIPMPEQVANLVAEAYGEMILDGEGDTDKKLDELFAGLG